MATNAISIQSDAGLTAALAGDAMSGFEDLYRKHYRRVYSICLRMTGNMAEAEARLHALEADNLSLRTQLETKEKNVL